MGDQKAFNEEIGLHEYIDVIVKRKRLILLFLLVAVIVGGIISLFQSKVYQATTLILITPSRADIALPTSPQPQQFSFDITRDVKTGAPLNRRSSISLPTHKMLLKSNVVIQRLISKLNLTGEGGRPLLPDELVGRLLIKEDAGISVFQLSVMDQDPSTAMNLANTWAQEYILFSQELIFGEMKGTSDFVADQFEIAKKNLVQAEQKIANFKDQYKLELMQDELYLKKKKVTSYKSKVMDLEVTIKTQEELGKGLKYELARQDKYIVTSKAIVDDAIWQQVVQGKDLDGLEKMKLRSEEINPVYQQLVSRIIDAETEFNVDKSKIEYLRGLIVSTDKEINELEKTINQKQIELSQLTREFDLYEKTYDILSSKIEEVRLGKSAQLGEVRLVSQAYKPQHPIIAPSKKKNMIVAGILGLMVGTLSAFFVESYKRKRKADS